MQEHLEFIGALLKRDGPRAIELLMAHIHSARERVIEAPLEQVRAEWAQPPAPASQPAANTRRKS